jgi:hypothetical protein
MAATLRLRCELREEAVGADAVSPGAGQAGRYLAELLKGRYRSRWDRTDYIVRTRHGELHQGAIAQVLAEHLRGRPRETRPADRDVEAGQLASLVSTTLHGVRLSRETLQAFIEAFAVSPEDARRLWEIHDGAPRIRALVDPPAVPPETAAALRPNRHVTRFVYDHHFIGADGMPSRHETLQVVEATVDGFDRYAYAFDTNALTVEVIAGAQLDGPLYQVRDDVYAVDLLLDRSLAVGEMCALDYRTTFRYATSPEPLFRRAMNIHVSSAGFAVTFHHAKRPRLVWWAIWDGLGREVVHQVPVTLDEFQTASRTLLAVKNMVAGFLWEW